MSLYSDSGCPLTISPDWSPTVLTSLSIGRPLSTQSWPQWVHPEAGLHTLFLLDGLLLGGSDDLSSSPLLEGPSPSWQVQCPTMDGNLEYCFVKKKVELKAFLASLFSPHNDMDTAPQQPEIAHISALGHFLAPSWCGWVCGHRKTKRNEITLYSTPCGWFPSCCSHPKSFAKWKIPEH